MAGITLEIAREKLKIWLAAEEELAINQSYTIGGKTFTRADLGEVAKRIDYWNNKVISLENAKKKGGRNRVYRVVPRDL